MAKVQLVVAQRHAAPRLCVLAGPTFRGLIAALQALPHSAYVAPHYWLVDTGGIARLGTAGLQVEMGLLEPALRELAHRVTVSMAGEGFPLWRPSTEQWP
jgi:hypothetical protein